MTDTTDTTVQDVTTQIDYDLPAPPKRPANAKWPQLYDPKYADIASRLVAVGFTEDDIAATLGVPLAAIRAWKHSFPDFKAAYKGGKRNQLSRMMAKALHEAVGYDYTTTKKETTYNEDGSIKGIKVTEATNHQAPQPNMLLFLACNLSSQLGLDEGEAWKSRQKMEVETKSINLTITGEAVSSQIERLAGKLLGNQTTPQLGQEGLQLAAGVLNSQIPVTDAQFEPETTESADGD
jgi:hypothetical protein